ncbi:hypothetical protein GCM10009785_34680 [Brooklawnia cerclae]|uniref:Uncharacterized protein n=1 Tax=Brooklawnia cerclae TaxID=349934 RepID=A0ABX0SKP7_9ACTN|nr:hypothetical protein [Brooklawnia cerclae]NIH57307.1 hypothetical protein [Brooklawnia cerclae]
MPKERQYDNSQSVEVGWAKDGQLVTVRIDETVTVQTVPGDAQRTEPAIAMWQATSADQVDALIEALRRAKRQAFGVSEPQPVVNVAHVNVDARHVEESIRRAVGVVTCGDGVTS